MMAGLELTAVRELAGGPAAERATPQPLTASAVLPSNMATTVPRQAREVPVKPPAMAPTVLPS
jgi:hypothetical protein